MGACAVVAPRLQPVLDLGEQSGDDARTCRVHLLVEQVVPPELDTGPVGDVEPVAPHPLAPAHSQTAEVSAPDTRGAGRRDGHEECSQNPATASGKRPGAVPAVSTASRTAITLLVAVSGRPVGNDELTAPGAVALVVPGR